MALRVAAVASGDPSVGDKAEVVGEGQAKEEVEEIEDEEEEEVGTEEEVTELSLEAELLFEELLGVVVVT